MKIPKATSRLMILAIVASKLAACSAGSGDAGIKGPLGGGASNGNGGSGAGNGNGGYNSSNGGIPIIDVGGGTGRDGSTGPTDPGECGVRQKPEEVIVYSPVALFIMQDRSSSMVGIAGDANSWPNSLNAITAFVNDPSSTGLDVGLAMFPPFPTPTTADQGDCATGTDCGAPVAEIGPLPQNASAITTGMQNSAPSNNFLSLGLTPTECALRGMINHCLDWTAKTGEQCVAILVTDGSPTTCDINQGNLVPIVADAKGKGILTFTLGLPGSDINFLNQLAQAGGTNQAVDVSQGQQVFIDALNAIRGKVSVGTALPCTWKIPPPKDGQVFDPAKVNVSFTPKGGAAADFGFVSQADCAKADNAWYFDDPNNPKQVLACPTTCDMLKAASGAEINVSFGCARKPAVLH